ncbi:hypothetical protein, partial [Acinetobacter bereziniae]
HTNVKYIKLNINTEETLLSVNLEDLFTINLNDENSINVFFLKFQEKNFYLDITGLTHSAWAPIIKFFSKHNELSIKVIYIEPSSYARKKAPLDNEFYNLSSHIKGVAPVNGFHTLIDSDKFTFVPLLGFEGARFNLINNTLEPTSKDSIIPLVGLPGFEPWYVFETIRGNRQILKITDSYQWIDYVPGDCTFSCYYKLEEILKIKKNLKVAPIGTKPHALAAFILALNYPNNVEIVYDHPIRTTKRTDGASKVHIYDIKHLFMHPPSVNINLDDRRRERRERRT